MRPAVALEGIGVAVMTVLAEITPCAFLSTDFRKGVATGRRSASQIITFDLMVTSALSVSTASRYPTRSRLAAANASTAHRRY